MIMIRALPSQSRQMSTRRRLCPPKRRNTTLARRVMRHLSAPSAGLLASWPHPSALTVGGGGSMRA